MSDQLIDLPIETVAFAESLADCARDLAMQHFRKVLDFDLKADESPVTIADRAIEQVLRQMIVGRYPSHGLFGEEEGSVAKIGGSQR